MEKENADGVESQSINDDNENGSVNNNRGSLRVDRYGFLEADYIHQPTLTVSEAMLKQRRHKENDRSKKWLRMLKKDSSSKIQERARKGIPDAVRGASWQWLFHLNSIEYEQIKLRYPNPSTILGEESSPESGVLDARTMDEVIFAKYFIWDAVFTNIFRLRGILIEHFLSILCSSRMAALAKALCEGYCSTTLSSTRK